jgi:hypothetical protein
MVRSPLLIARQGSFAAQAQIAGALVGGQNGQFTAAQGFFNARVAIQ